MRQFNETLIVSNDAEFKEVCGNILCKRGYKYRIVESESEAIDQIYDGGEYCVVIIHTGRSDLDGIGLLKRIKEFNSKIEVLIVANNGEIDNAVETIKLGAADYITKPIGGGLLDNLAHALDNISKLQSLERELEELKAHLKEKYNLDNIIGQSSEMQKAYEIISSVSKSDANVLIRGETGTGKELVAKAIHYNSYRKDKPFIKVDCAALTETLLESELFGHVEGAFTDAIRNRVGRFRLADGGTIFLDEIGNVSASVQAKLLRVLQDNEFEPVGSDETIHVDVRVIAATNIDLEKYIDNGEFRRDLYYRLNVVSIHLPSLRDRKDDIPLLAAYFLIKYREKNKKSVEFISRATLNKLMSYEWHGNVRELENVIERAVILCKGNKIEPEDLLLPTEGKIQIGYETSEGKSLRESMNLAEKNIILSALDKTGWDKSRAAELLEISRSTLYNKIAKYGIISRIVR